MEQTRRQRELIKDQRQKIISQRRTARGFFSNRYILIVAVIEIFFRKYMGERYFTHGIFFAGLVGLLALRFWVSYPNFFSFVSYDVFLIAYVVMSGLHFTTLSKLKDMGIRRHSYYIGDSRFAFLGKYLNSKNPNFAAWVYIEPLVVFLLVVPIIMLTNSLLLGIGAVIGGARLWYENWRTVRDFRHDELDRLDGQIVSSHVAGTMDETTEVETLSPPPVPRTANIPIPPPIPLMDSEQDELTPMEALKRLNRKGNDTKNPEE